MKIVLTSTLFLSVS